MIRPNKLSGEESLINGISRVKLPFQPSSFENCYLSTQDFHSWWTNYYTQRPISIAIFLDKLIKSRGFMQNTSKQSKVNTNYLSKLLASNISNVLVITQIVPYILIEKLYLL